MHKKKSSPPFMCVLEMITDFRLTKLFISSIRTTGEGSHKHVINLCVRFFGATYTISRFGLESQVFKTSKHRFRGFYSVYYCSMSCVVRFWDWGRTWTPCPTWSSRDHSKASWVLRTSYHPAPVSSPRRRLTHTSKAYHLIGGMDRMGTFCPNSLRNLSLACQRVFSHSKW